MEHSFPIKTTFNNNKTGYMNNPKMKKQIIIYIQVLVKTQAFFLLMNNLGLNIKFKHKKYL